MLPPVPARPSLTEIFLVSLRLGCTSFGGPVAHLAFFREEFVARRRWLDDAHYADLVALCQFLPGPASSQACFGVGFLQRGLPGGVLASLGFTLPSAVLMIGFALGLARAGDFSSAGWLHGLKAASVAVVAQAVWLMWRNLSPDLPRSAVAAGAACLLLRWPETGSQIAVIAAGALIGWRLLRPAESPVSGIAAPSHSTNPKHSPATARSVAGIACLLLFTILLISLPWLAHAGSSPALDLFDRFYRAGSLVFGGGHVVLPLLEREVVAPGWVSPDQFLAGYGAAQAMPGPLFSFAGYLGAATTHGGGGIGGGILALVAIFLPAFLLVGGALPYWQRLRTRPGAQAAMRGANAAVVGVLFAALIHPVGTLGLVNLRSAAMAAGALFLLQLARLPAWSVVALAALAGAMIL